MFKLETKWLVIGLLILCLLGAVGGYWHWTTSQLDRYKALSEKQAQTINRQQNQITQLNADLEKKEQQILIERETVKKQTALEQQERNVADEDIKVITKIIYKDLSGCANAALPDDVIKRLRKSSNPS